MSGRGEKNNNRPDQEEAIPTASFGAGAIGPSGQIGPYKLLSLLGEGGFAMVYLAEQERPVKRRVALKVIKPGMDSKQVIARFEAERQALALLDHPNVAHVYDAGTTDFGRPYFAMECVKGVPITEHCDRQMLTIEERLKLFLQICEAVQHAHQKGIIHRDIKPSNILILFEGQRALPKVIDFGIAKAISQPLTERTLYTEQGQMVGTPEYMSPEQAEMTAQDVDTRSDIYSLGVLLYELLTGVLPFEAEVLREGGLEHIRQVIREEEPKTPSTRLSRLSGEESTKLAQHRHTNPGVLQRRLRGDLDWITLKAMEKDRTRRYETAHALSQDIQRHLDDEAVVAGPPGAVYRLKKFVRRHRASVTATAAVAAAIVMGFVVSTTLYFQAEQARKKEAIARAEAMAARDEAKQAEKSAQQQRQRAQSLLARAQLERGVGLLNEGNCLGLLDILDARITADEIPDLRDSTARLWAIAYDPWSDRLVHVLPHADNLAFNPDGKLLATVEDETAQLWSTATGQPHGPPLPLEKEIGAIVFSPDGKLLAAHSVEGVARLWDTATGHPVGPVLRYDDGKTVIWPGNAWHSAAFSPDGKLLATASLDGTVRLWKTDTGQSYGEPLRHEGMVWTVAFSPDGKLLASGLLNGTARLWDVTSGETHGPPLQHRGRIEKVAFRPDGKLVATASHDGTAGLWKTDTGQIHKLLRHTGLITDLAFNPDGKLLATASSDWVVRLWDTTTGKARGEPLLHDGRVFTVAFSPDGRLLATGSVDRTARLWEVSSGQPYGQPLRRQGNIRRVAFSPDGKFLAITGMGGLSQIWRTYRRLHTEVVTQQGGAQLGAISPDGKVGATISGDTVRLWDTTTGKMLGEGLCHDRKIRAVAFSPDGKLLATGLSEAIQLWDVATRQPFRPPLKSDAVETLVFSPDGKLLAGGSYGWNAQVFEVAEGRRLHYLSCDDWIYAVAFSPNGKVLATGSRSGTTEQWDVATGQQYASQLRHRGPVWAVAYSPDGNLLATASGDKAQTVRFWDLSTGPPYHSLAMPAQAVQGKAALRSFSSDGTVLIRRLADGTAHIWRVPKTPTNLREIQVRTWVALGALRNEQGEAKAIPHQQWQRLREELHSYGVRGPQASRPQPANGADLALGTKLRWIPGLDAVAHNVYFGTGPKKLKLLGRVEEASYANLPTLEKRQWYCWRVDEVQPDGSVVKGDLWSFSTGKMVGWWKFDGDAKDSSGYGNDGTKVGNPTYGPGKLGQAISLNLADTNDYLIVPDSAAIEFGDESFSICLWVKSSFVAGSDKEFIVCNGTNGTEYAGASGKRYVIKFEDSDFRFAIDGDFDGGKTILNGSSVSFATGEWVHAVAVHDREADELRLYCNGVLENTKTDVTTGDISSPNEPLFIGAKPEEDAGASGPDSVPISHFFSGILDDVRIYSYALSQADVAAIHAGKGLGPLEKPEWIVDVGRQEYTPPEPQPEEGDESMRR